MATLVLQTAGQALGGAIAGPIGAAIGQAAGGIAGSIVDQALFGPPPRQIEGPRLTNLHVTGSTEGAPLPAIWGRMRVAGQLIWATEFEEEVTHRQQGGGKGSLSRPTAEYTEYAYYGNFALALCAGPITRIGRVWADGKEINPAQFVLRLHNGSQDQTPDSLIEAKEGSGNAPAYRGVAYIVFERLPLAQFGNRLPQLSFEVFRALDGLESKIEAVNIIPGSTEFGYDTQKVRREDGFGGTLTENVHTFQDRSDFLVSMDQLQSSCTNLGAANLVVAWFGDDLRCGACTVRPLVDNKDKQTEPVSWKVAGQDRAAAGLVSQIDGRAAYGGTPDDGSVIRAISELNQRGLDVCFYPFVLMDIPAGNTLPDPYGAGAGQAAYPWRGQITCMPSIGQPATVDGTVAAKAQMDAFFGTASAADFSTSAGEVVYSGPAEWSYRRMILHYAHLCALAGGVESFLIGSEFVALNRVRDDAGDFVAVEHLRALAGEVATILPSAKLSYAADWSEYANYRPADGSGDVWFHLDGLWADANIDFIGIDNYMPLSDWRPGQAHVDWQAGWRSIYDAAYLQHNIEGAEGYDWYYASEADRAAQTRSPISDTAYGKHWVFRSKDVAGWWSNPHLNRPAGAEAATPTGWVPASKPVRFTEIGVPAVNHATNQPNVFYDPKSSVSALPYFSSGARDDYLQRVALTAIHDYWSQSTNNPVSGLYGGPMVDAAHMGVWAWDSRPYPSFPFLSDVWSDGANHDLGHWLNGRMGALELRELVRSVLLHYGFQDFEVGTLPGVVEGFAIDRPMSARGALEALADMFQIDMFEADGKIRCQARAASDPTGLANENIALTDNAAAAYQVRRVQESELPAQVCVQYSDSAIEYRPASASAQRLATTSRRKMFTEFSGVLSFSEAQGLARRLLNETWSGKETVTFAVPPSQMALEPGDIVHLSDEMPDSAWRVVETRDAGLREVQAVRHESAALELTAGAAREASVAVPAISGRGIVAVLDPPLLADDANPNAPWVAAAAKPWPGRYDVHRIEGENTATTLTSLPSAAVIGTIQEPLLPGPLYVWDRGSRLRVRLSVGELESVSEEALFAGANTALVGSSTGNRELLQFKTAVLVDTDTYELSDLLRGQAGTETEMLAGAPLGAQFVLLDASVRQMPASSANLGLEYSLRVGPGNVDLANPLMQDFTFSFTGRALRPLSPVHGKVEPAGADLNVSWVRRTRVGGDSWQGLEVPLGEEAETYEVEVESAGTVYRTLGASVPGVTYGFAEQQADFAAGLPGDLVFKIYQVSPVYGRGTPLIVSLYD